MTDSSEVIVRGVEDGDWPGMALLAATCFGVWHPPELRQMWQSLLAPGCAVVACDGPDIVGTAVALDLEVTVPGGALLPMAGISWVAVSPTHRRRGVLRSMFTELHARINRFPIAGLEASEAGIYSRFGYGPATVVRRLTVDRAAARFHVGVPAAAGVRVVHAAEHRCELEDVYERWRLQTPGGLHTPGPWWDEVLTDRPEQRGGGSAMFCLLHADGYALYRVHRGEDKSHVEIGALTAVTPAAHAALWRTLLGMDLMATVAVRTHPDDALPYLLTDPRLVRTTGVDDGLWLRLVDIPTVLEARHYAADVSLVLDVADDELDGGGRFSLDVRGGRARCVPTTADADVHADLSVLGSLYFGAHRASAFATAGRLRCTDPAVVAGLDAAFASAVPAQLGFGF